MSPSASHPLALPSPRVSVPAPRPTPPFSSSLSPRLRVAPRPLPSCSPQDEIETSEPARATRGRRARAVRRLARPTSAAAIARRAPPRRRARPTRSAPSHRRSGRPLPAVERSLPVRALRAAREGARRAPRAAISSSARARARGPRGAIDGGRERAREPGARVRLAQISPARSGPSTAGAGAARGGVMCTERFATRGRALHARRPATLSRERVSRKRRSARAPSRRGGAPGRQLSQRGGGRRRPRGALTRALGSRPPAASLRGAADFERGRRAPEKSVRARVGEIALPGKKAPQRLSFSSPVPGNRARQRWSVAASRRERKTRRGTANGPGTAPPVRAERASRARGGRAATTRPPRPALCPSARRKQTSKGDCVRRSGNAASNGAQPAPLRAPRRAGGCARVCARACRRQGASARAGGGAGGLLRGDRPQAALVEPQRGTILSRRRTRSSPDAAGAHAPRAAAAPRALRRRSLSAPGRGLRFDLRDRRRCARPARDASNPSATAQRGVARRRRGDFARTARSATP